MARTILKAKDQVHQLAAELASQAASVAGVRGAALEFTRELVKSIPIVPVDAKLTAAARAIQMAGIALCLIEGRPLAKCDCFIDLALTETKERVSQILQTRLANWAELARSGPAPAALQARPRDEMEQAGVHPCGSQRGSQAPSHAVES
jgi:hypothetical protein